jgi:hypothetical protein
VLFYGRPAFFAYRGISNAVADKAPSTSKVRILVFNQRQWRSDFLQVLLLSPAHLHFSIGEFVAIENEGMIPQQAASTVTNVDEIEAYIASIHSNGKRIYPRLTCHYGSGDAPYRSSILWALPQARFFLDWMELVKT